MRTNLYVDGFNLYYGCMKGTPYRWLDLATLAAKLFPGHEINRIRYFTAKVQPPPWDPQKTQRQDLFLRALGTIPNLTIHFGTFLSHPREMPLAKPLPGGPRMVEVIRTEEKGSDVNLASYLLLDAFENDYEQAAVISNDSDLVTPILLVQERLGRHVGVVNPHVRLSMTPPNERKYPSLELRKAASFYREIREGALRSSQFPPTLEDGSGRFAKPSAW